MSETEDSLLELSDFLKAIGETNLSNYFARVREVILGAASHNDRREAAQRGLALFAGMNSFNDLVIMNGNNAAQELNDQLDRLRGEAFSSLVEIALNTSASREEER